MQVEQTLHMVSSLSEIESASKTNDTNI